MSTTKTTEGTKRTEGTKTTEGAAEPVVAAVETAQTIKTTAETTAREVADTARRVTDESVAIAQKGLDRTVAHLHDSVAAATANVAQSQTKLNQQVENMMKTAEQFVAFGQGNVEALTSSGQIFANGLQEIGKQIAASTQASIEETAATYRALTGVKSFKDAMELQASLMRNMMQRSVTDTGRVADASLRLVEQAMAPITARVSLATEQFGRPV
jgi:phasin family protein